MLPLVFYAYGVPRDEAVKIIDEACMRLICKRPLRVVMPEAYLLRTIIERSRRWQEETSLGDSPQ